MFKSFLTTLLLFVLIWPAQADKLVLKNGLTLQGKFKGASETTIKFETSGAVQDVAISEVKSITFEAAEQPATGAASPASGTALSGTAAGTPGAAGALAPSSSGTQIPAGTKLMIRTNEDVGTASHQQGAKFKCALDADLVVDGKLIAPKNTEIYGIVLESIGGRRIGNQRIVVSFNQISLNGQLVSMATDDVGAEGGRGGAARAVGAGALIGAAAGDAGKGAAVGAGLALLAGGKHITIPTGSVVEVSLKQGITVP